MSILQLRAPRSLSILVAAVAALAIAAPTAGAARTERVTTATYVVTGSTEDEIRASLDARHPGGFDARTNWYVTWSYASAMRSGRCHVTTSKVHTKIAFTYPRWAAPADASAELATSWTTYMGKLRVHESGHARIGRGVAARVQNVLTATTAATCASLDRALPGLVQPQFTWGNAADVSYDRRTQHGATQGAVFPAN
ncbi:MAG: putative secreted Zn-dependent protease [Thermoleophilia bacterium]|nr:putative secreted Zn-dependent protease [Thermoleophilia bacterium]